MANDAPFADPTPAAPADPTPAPASAAPDPQAAGRVLQQAISGALAPVMQRMEQLEQRLHTPAQPATPPPASGSDDWIDRLADPAKFDELVNERVRNLVGPALLPMAEAARRTAESEQKAWVSEEYGDDFWQEHVAERYEQIMGQLQRTNPVATISQEHIQTVVSSILGGRELAPVVAQARAKNEQVRAANRAQAPRFVGPGRPNMQDHDPVSDEDKAIIARINRSLGKDAITEKDILDGRKNRATMEVA